jgi:hypothetical protein
MKNLVYMYALSCLISFQNIALGRTIKIREVATVSIKKGLQNLVNTSTIVLPKNLLIPPDKKITDLFNIGDKVTIELGYNQVLNTEFIGYIRSVKHDIPLVIECEDEMFNLKQITLKSKAFKKATLKTIIDYVLADTPYKAEIIDTTVDDFVIDNNVSVALVFQYLKEKLGITFSFNNRGVLVCGFPYSFDPQNNVYIADFEQNIASSNLEYKNKDEVNIKLIGISHQKGKKPIRYEYNPSNALAKEAETRTLNFNNLSESELKEKVKEQYKRIQSDGYKGSITLFGLPFVEPFEAIKLRHKVYPDREGLYLVNDVNVTFNNVGYRRELVLGKKI